MRCNGISLSAHHTQAPLSQPRNAIAGQIVGAVSGIVCKQYIADAGMGGNVVLALPVAIAVALFVMSWTRTVHP